MRESFEGAFAVFEIRGFVLEDQLDIGETKNRERTEMGNARDTVHPDLKWNGDLLLDLFGGDPRPLRNDFDVVIGDVGICLDRELVKGNRAPREEAVSLSPVSGNDC